MSGGMLAFASAPPLIEEGRHGVIACSLRSGGPGYAVLRFAPLAVDACEAEAAIDREIAQEGDIAVIEEMQQSRPLR